MRAVDKPLPGDLVIRPRADQTESHPRTIFVITSWPDADRIVAGPYQSFGYALRQARDGFRFSAVGKKLDLAALDTGNRDFTVALDLGGTQFVKNRNLEGKKRVFKLPRGRRR